VIILVLNTTAALELVDKQLCEDKEIVEVVETSVEAGVFRVVVVLTMG
jgi:hypothetical protein